MKEEKIVDNNNIGVYSYIEIANYFIREHKKTGDFVTNMQLQKLLYFTNGIYLYYKNKPLIKEKFQAWRYGPVIKQLYDDLKYAGSSYIKNTIDAGNQVNIEDDVYILLQSVDRAYGTMDGWKLSEISHIKEGAWDKATGLDEYLNDEDIKIEFEKFHIPSLTTSKGQLND